MQPIPSPAEPNVFQDASAHLFTIRDLLRFAVSRYEQAELFFGHGSSSAYDEAAWLILRALHLPADRLEPFLDARLLPAERDTLLGLIKARVETRKPAAYLLNEAWLGDYRFYVDERVIVPRSFIAELIRDEALLPWIEYPELVNRALDLCTGSGCLAIMLADAFPDAEVDAVDISPDALAVAEINVKTYGLQDRVALVMSDMFNSLEGRYDLIISNPPYVDAPSVAELPAEYLHEPELALGSGEDGLDAVREILTRAPDFLTDQGVLVVEIGHNRLVLEAAFPELPFNWMPTSGGDGFVFVLSRGDLLDLAPL